MFRLGHPYFMWLLIVVIPLSIILYILFRYYKQRKIHQLINEKSQAKIIIDYNSIKQNIKFILSILALSCLLFAAADPQIGNKLSKVKRKGAEIIIAIDVSNSMLAEDVYPSRIEAAKMALEKLIDKLDEHRIGVIVFAGDAFVQLPITSDYVSAKMFLSSINTNLVPIQGTNIASAINLAIKSFTNTNQQEKNKVLIIISDGEDHEGGAIDMAKEAANKGIVIHTIGMGKPQGAPIPIINKFGKKDYKTDKYGNVIITKTNDAVLQQIATVAGGMYVRAQNATVILNEIVNKIEEINKKEIEAEIYSDFDHQYQYPLLLSIILFTIEFFIVERKWKRSLFQWFNLSNLKKNNSLTLIFIILLSLNAYTQEYKKEIRKGNDLYMNKKYKESEVAFRKAYKLNPNDFKTAYNLANALYKQGKFEDAEKLYNESTVKSKEQSKLTNAYYNLGNAFIQQRKIDESIEAYKQALRRNPLDTQAKYNLSYALMLKKQQQNQQNNNQNQQKNQQQNQQQQNQQQQQQENQQNKQQISKEEAERMLQALQNEEKEQQDKIKKQLIEATKHNIEKDW